MMRSLIKTIREGRITKSMARLIIRKFKKRNILIDPKLVYSDNVKNEYNLMIPIKCLNTSYKHH